MNRTRIVMSALVAALWLPALASAQQPTVGGKGCQALGGGVGIINPNVLGSFYTTSTGDFATFHAGVLVRRSTEWTNPDWEMLPRSTAKPAGARAWCRPRGWAA